jgi:hypothetical protein
VRPSCSFDVAMHENYDVSFPGHMGQGKARATLPLNLTPFSFIPW